jgi:hypothetical protein
MNDSTMIAQTLWHQLRSVVTHLTTAPSLPSGTSLSP